MVSGNERRILGFGFVIVALLGTAYAANAQQITVDAAPSHAVNTFSPFRALGAAIDRLPTGTPDRLLTDPVLDALAARHLQFAARLQTLRQADHAILNQAMPPLEGLASHGYA